MLFSFLPILSLTAFILIIIIIEAFVKNKDIVYHTSIIAIICVGISIVFSFDKNVDFLPQFITNMLTFDRLTSFFDLLFIISALLTVYLTKNYLERLYSHITEFYPLILISLLGMMLISHSKNLLVLFIGIEMMSICFYALSGFIRTEIKSIEAAIKYFIIGAFATGFLLFGISFIYGASGSLDYQAILQAIMYNQLSNDLYLLIGISLLIIGLGFKLAVFPFHQWAPDVYTGAPTIVSGFMSTAGKAAGFIALISFVSKILMNLEYVNSSIQGNLINFQYIIAGISALTMIIGNITALVQKNIKRMLAYSSIAHAGYMMMGIVAANYAGIKGIAFYLLAYTFMQIGAFIAVASLENDSSTDVSLIHFKGLAKRQPLLSALTAVMMFSLVGLPPFAGFIGKYLLFKSAIEGGFLWLTIVAIVASMISIYYYIRIIIEMYFSQEESTITVVNLQYNKVVLIICAAALIVLGVFPNFILNLIN
jgi:NADH-quinone oxidoreductase subunit N